MNCNFTTEDKMGQTAITGDFVLAGMLAAFSQAESSLPLVRCDDERLCGVLRMMCELSRDIRFRLCNTGVCMITNVDQVKRMLMRGANACDELIAHRFDQEQNAVYVSHIRERAELLVSDTILTGSGTS